MADYMKRLMQEMLKYDWMNRENNYSKKGGLSLILDVNQPP